MTEIPNEFPFPRVSQIDNKSPAQIRAMGLLPGFHPHCRCDIQFLWGEVTVEAPKLGKIIPGSKASPKEIAKHYARSAKAIEGTKKTSNELKEAIAKRLGKRMDDLNMSEWKKLAEGLSMDGSSESAVDQLIRGWAATSGDTNPKSIMMQLAAKKEFGLEGASLWWEKAALYKATELFKVHEVAARRFLREMYNDTQDYLEKQGLKTVRVARGHKGDVGIEVSTLKKKMEKVDVQLQPMSSFSSDLGTAQSFAQSSLTEDVSLFFAEIPADRILSCPITGFGCLNEAEWVVLGSPKAKETMLVSVLAKYHEKNPIKAWPSLFAGPSLTELKESVFIEISYLVE